MIGKLYYNDSFDRLSAYVLQQQGKLAEVLAVNGVRVSSPAEMAADFAFQRSTRPDVTMAAEHVSLAWPPSETEKLTNEVMTQAAMRYMQSRGIDPEQTQWVVARHYDEDHPHCHLLLNRVTNDGSLLPDKFSKEDSLAACRQVEAEMGFVDAKKLGAAQELAKAEQPGQPVEKLHRLQLKALVTQALEKHLPTATTMTGLQETLRTKGLDLRIIQQQEQSRGAVFTAEAYPGLHIKGSEIDRQYGAQELFKTLEAQEKRAQEVQLRAMLLAALEKHVPGATNLTELQLGLAREGVAVRPHWHADGQLKEISFASAAFPKRELPGEALSPQFEAGALTQTLARQEAVRRAAEQREAEELRKLIPQQERHLAQLPWQAKQAEKQGEYEKLSTINYTELPLAVAQLAAYKEQAQATEAGRLVLKELADTRETTRRELQPEGQRVLEHSLAKKQGSCQSWAEYEARVEQAGFAILEPTGQPAQLLHVKSGETFDLALLQPGGATAPRLRQQVQQEGAAQQEGHWRAERMLVDVLKARQFTSYPELDQQLQKQAYKRTIQPDGKAWLEHEPSGRQFILAELLPNGQRLEPQVDAAMARRQTELVRGQVEVGPGAGEPAAERAKQFQQLLEAAGAQVIAGLGLPVAGKAMLEYRYEWKGANLEAVNQALRQVQSAPEVLVREQSEGFQQPQSQWPVRVGEEGRATLVIAATSERTAAERVKGITSLLHERGAWINAERPQQNGTVELELGYRTKHPDFPALSGMLDKWKTASNKVEVLETPYGRLVRAEVRQVGADTLPTPAKRIELPAQKTDEYERD
ncbi:relaxase/mobilization nuclease domain-containing protein [Hymenobacter sp. BT559]|uniref:relaxase/mobilization nuclease domain-containing protein n=1 Tax=Hymenobacter sp. BT559 TaxID=2795729 RepID=UPI0018EDE314|nr:relaxase/mobilization nuclease domain-containing protein [Hymenobacter sp. BT559]MBJ6146191.1 relaxase/mobilization nuclease domain-containing protein [Hymenobacter sp. BT559]